MSENTVTTKKFLDMIGLDAFWSKICAIFATKDELNNLVGQVGSISSGLKVTASVSPTIIYKGTATNVTISGTVKNNSGNVTASEIKIKSGTNVLTTASDSATISHKVSLNTTNNSTSYIIEAIASGLPLSTSISVTARYPVYYGMGTSAEAIISSGNKASARTTAVSSTAYNGTASADGVRFYLLVPSDVTRPTSFTMGGAPVDMASATATLNSITYYVFYTNATYNTGASVQIKAS